MPVAISTMKAVRIHSYGGPETLIYEDAPTPDFKSNEVLVRVLAAGVNPVDWKIREGYMGRAALPQVMGIDFSGIIEETGSEVSEFGIGEDVFGEVGEDWGSFAEFTAAPEVSIARKPQGLDHKQAAALPVASLTAWQAIFDVAHLQAGQKILIHAAAGGVGGFATQFAKIKGAQVIGTASAGSAEYVRQLGADQVIDYRSARFEDVVRDADVVFDTIGGETEERSYATLKRGGILVSIIHPPSESLARAHGVTAVFIRQKPNGNQLAAIADLVVKGKVKVNIDTVLPLSEARKALDLSQSGHVHGKIILQVSQ